MKKKIILLTSLFSVVAGTLVAQQDKLITHFMYDKMSINPGETGVDQGDNSICANTIYRNQWDKVNGAPNSAVLNVESNLRRFMPVNLGVSFFHDAIGFNRQNNVLLNAAFPLPLNPGTLSVGVGVGMVNFGMSPTWVPPQTAIDPTLPVGFSATNVDMNFGVYWKGNADYYAGLSSTHLNESILTQTVGTIPQTYQVARHYYIMGGKKFSNIGQNGQLDANVLMRTDFVKFSADINARYIWNNQFYGGLTYRTSDAIAVMVGWMPIQGAVIGYSYDVNINKLASVSRGSHEILLKYCYYIPKPPITKSNHPRWL